MCFFVRLPVSLLYCDDNFSKGIKNYYYHFYYNYYIIICMQCLYTLQISRLVDLENKVHHFSKGHKLARIIEAQQRKLVVCNLATQLTGFQWTKQPITPLHTNTHLPLVLQTVKTYTYMKCCLQTK